MKCHQCKKEIEDESQMIILPPDGDVLCGKECEKKFFEEYDEFMNKIGDDEWYKRFMDSP